MDVTLQDWEINCKLLITFYYLLRFFLYVLAKAAMYPFGILLLWGWAGYPAVPDHQAGYSRSGKRKPNYPAYPARHAG